MMQMEPQPQGGLEMVLKALGRHGDQIRPDCTKYGIDIEELGSLKMDEMKEMGWPLRTRRAVDAHFRGQTTTNANTDAKAQSTSGPDRPPGLGPASSWSEPVSSEPPLLSSMLPSYSCPPMQNSVAPMAYMPHVPPPAWMPTPYASSPQWMLGPHGYAIPPASFHPPVEYPYQWALPPGPSQSLKASDSAPDSPMVMASPAMPKLFQTAQEPVAAEDEITPILGQKPSIWVGGLPLGVKEADIRRVFGQYGKIDSVALLTKHAEHNKKFFIAAFVNFATLEAAQRACTALSGSKQLGSEGLTIEMHKANNQGRPPIAFHLPRAHARFIKCIESQLDLVDLSVNIDCRACTVTITGTHSDADPEDGRDVINKALADMYTYEFTLDTAQLAHFEKSLKLRLLPGFVAFDINKTQRLLTLMASEQSSLNDGVEHVQQLLGHASTTSSLEVSLEEAVFLFKRRQNELNKVKQQLGVRYEMPRVNWSNGKNTWLNPADDTADSVPQKGKARLVKPAPKTTRPLAITGPTAAVDRFKTAIAQMLRGLTICSHESHVPRETYIAVSVQIAASLKSFISENDVVLEYSHNDTPQQPLPSKVKFSLRAWGVDENMVKSGLDKLKAAACTEIAELVFKAEEYQVLNKLLTPEKQVKYEREWDVTIRLLEKEKGHVIQLTSVDKDTISSAKEKLFVLLHHRTPHIDRQEIKDPMTKILLEGDLRHELEGIAIKHKVHLLFRSTSQGNVSCELHGMKAQVNQVSALLYAHVKAELAQTIEKSVVYPAHVLDIFQRNDNALKHNMEREYKVLLTIAQANTTIATLTLANGTVVNVRSGDLLKEHADVIVNAANSALDHCGGIANIIAEKAGPVIVAESKKWIRENGNVKEGTVAVTTAGKLRNVMHIIHAVGPNWNGTMTSNSTARHPNEILKHAISAALRRASKLNARSISIPALSTGIYGGDAENCATIMIDATHAFFAECKSSTLKEVSFVMSEPGKAAVFSRCLQNSKQTRRATSKRHVPGSAPKSPQWQWSWQRDDKGFQDYPADLNNQIQTAYIAQGGNGKTTVISGKVQYELDFDTKRQKNVVTGFVRRLQSCNTTLVLPQPLEWNRGKRTIEADADDESSEKLSSSELHVRGLPSQVKAAITAINSKVMQATSQTREVSIPSRVSKADRKKLKKVARKYQLDSNISTAQSIIILQGLEEDMTKAENEIVKMFASRSDSVEYPDTWTEQSEEVALIQVSRDSAEWNIINQKVNETLPNVAIVKIDRVQNRPLWDRYYKERDRVARKNGNNPNAYALFHGTRGTDPATIWRSEDGFDMRHSNNGMWGQGIYFAANASYSYNYSSTVESNVQQVHQFFLAEVSTGASKTLSPDRSLRLPPELPTGSAGGVRARYDSINGTTGGSVVYILYQNCMAYPTYLISFITKA